MVATTALEQILVYAAHNWHVFPLHWPEYIDEQGREIGCSCGDRRCSIGKHPYASLVPHGVKDATVDEKTIRDWYRREPNVNWAIALGSVSGLIVVDIDPRHGGDESLRDLEARHGPLPLTPRVFTGGGGTHLFFAHPGGIVKNSSSKIGIGIDLKADGGYVVAPPSMHMMHRSYRWDIGAHFEDLELAAPPSWLYEQESNGHLYHVGGAEPLPDIVPQGVRDNTMISYAGTLRARGLIESEIFESLIIVNRRFDPPLDERDLERIAHSAASYDPGEFAQGHLETANPAPVTVEDFPITALTDVLQIYGQQAATTYDTDPATVICVMLAFASGAMGYWSTRLNAEWEESALLWLGLVGDPGMRKTPIIKAVGRPFVEWHRDKITEHRIAYGEWLEDKKRLKRDELGPEPELQQRLFDDTTMEALAPRFVSDPRGGMIDRDELTGFVASMNQYKARGGADRSNWLSIWAGRHVTINRKGEQLPIYIARPYLALVGGIQPERLGSLLSEEGNDGFLDRFLFALMPAGIAKGRHRSALENTTITRWRTVIRTLLANEHPCLLPLSTQA
jgi:putative DNA primase/helicase